MKVLICNDQPDCAGVGYGWMRAAQEYTSHEVHSVANGANIFDYPQDWWWDRDREALAALTPDLYMLTNGITDVCRRLGWFEVFPPGPAIVVHHGSDIRYGTRPNYDKGARKLSYDHNWPVYVTTPDLEWLIPDVQWLPAAISTVPPRDPQERFRIVHAPTARKLKGTQAFIDAVASLRGKYDFDVDIIEGVPNAECLRRKAKADLFFDQAMFGYGLNAVEAMAMGIPVISGALNPNCTAYLREKFGELPYTDADDIAARIVAFINEPELRSIYSKRGKDYVATYHHPKVVAGMLNRIWEAA